VCDYDKRGVFFIIPLYILGLLQRFGPQHGYQIKKIIADQLADFTQIKLPTIYYHLEKMQAGGLLSVTSEKPGGRPEKSVYAVTKRASARFRACSVGCLILNMSLPSRRTPCSISHITWSRSKFQNA
jgi:DNA-binding PadR family transcriptional regulator